MYYSHKGTLVTASVSLLTADLIATAAQLTNQRLVCVLEACALGGDKVELILNRAFPLRS